MTNEAKTLSLASKWVILISSTILLLSLIFGGAYNAMKTYSDVKINANNIQTTKDDVEFNDTQITILHRSQAVIQNDIANIKDNIQDIKEDVRVLAKRKAMDDLRAITENKGGT